jgi:hypothetical protein
MPQPPGTYREAIHDTTNRILTYLTYALLDYGDHKSMLIISHLSAEK